MNYRNGNYSAFYVDEPFDQSNLKAPATPDFRYYNLLRAWKASDSQFPFNDSHNKTYNVRDGSNWELTLKPRLHERLNNSKNIILFLSSITKNSRALREEIEFGILNDKLPVIVIYPEYGEKNDLLTANHEDLNNTIKNLWDKLPAFKNAMNNIPTLHIPLNQVLIKSALNNQDFVVGTRKEKNYYLYK